MVSDRSKISNTVGSLFVALELRNTVEHCNLRWDAANQRRSGHLVWLSDKKVEAGAAFVCKHARALTNKKTRGPGG